MKFQNTFSRILDGLILLVFILFFASAGFQDKSTSGWYQQWLPNLNGNTIQDITFLDSLTGFAVTNPGTSIYCYILKTTNGGDNWTTNYTYNSGTNIRFTKIQFSNNNIGFASTNYYDFFKTTNNGQTWSNYPNVPFGAEDMAVINKDTILVVSSLGFGGGVYRSINGGLNWSLIWTNGSSGNPDKIYMYDKNIGFACTDSPSSSIFYRTSNGGLNWTNLNDSTFYGIQFYDSLIGWKQTINSVKKTTNGGLSWNRQITPIFFDQGFTDLSIINKDTLWYVGSAIYRYNHGYGVICISTNGGNGWGYQLPDSSIKISRYTSIKFINKYNGWAYVGTSGVHTKLGGNDSTIFTCINNVNNTEISDYQLFQNYPNPFNPSTTISYSLAKTGDVSIKVFDISGKEIVELVNKRLQAGIYKSTFNSNKCSSGIYFYSMIIDGKVVDTKKMMYVK